MAKQSAGILLYRLKEHKPEFFLVHPGGPFWTKKDLHAWSVPKGEFDENEDPLKAALREFHEETGITLSCQPFRLTPVKQKSGKIVYCFACEGDPDLTFLKSNTFSIEWPPKSGKRAEFPEIDRGEWFSAAAAREKINEAQVPFIDELILYLAQSEQNPGK
jgi:predicted NUDIX family NTP pyrophosphohydrolase